MTGRHTNRRKPGHAFAPMTQHARARSAIARGDVRAMPSRGGAASRVLGRRCARARLPAANGLHRMRNRGRRRVAKLAGNEGKRELEHAANGLTNSKQFKGGFRVAWRRRQPTEGRPMAQQRFGTQMTTCAGHCRPVTCRQRLTLMPRSERCPTRLTGSGVCVLRWRL